MDISLASIPPFDVLEPADLEAVLEVSEQVELRVGDRLMSRGAQVDDIVVILSGVVRLEGPGLLAVELQRGGLVGLAPVSISSPAQVDATVVVAGEGLSMPGGSFQRLREDAGFDQAVSERLGDRLRRSSPTPSATGSASSVPIGSVAGGGLAEIDPETPVTVAARRLVAGRAGFLLVAGEPPGLVTELDLCGLVGEDADGICVGQIARRPLSLPWDLSVGDAMLALSERSESAATVTVGGQVVAAISERDVLAFAAGGVVGLLRRIRIGGPAARAGLWNALRDSLEEMAEHWADVDEMSGAISEVADEVVRQVIHELEPPEQSWAVCALGRYARAELDLEPAASVVVVHSGAEALEWAERAAAALGEALTDAGLAHPAGAASEQALAAWSEAEDGDRPDCRVISGPLELDETSGAGDPGARVGRQGRGFHLRADVLVPVEAFARRCWPPTAPTGLRLVHSARSGAIESDLASELVDVHRWARRLVMRRQLTGERHPEVVHRGDLSIQEWARLRRVRRRVARLRR